MQALGRASAGCLAVLGITKAMGTDEKIIGFLT